MWEVFEEEFHISQTHSLSTSPKAMMVHMENVDSEVLSNFQMSSEASRR